MARSPFTSLLAPTVALAATAALLLVPTIASASPAGPEPWSDIPARAAGAESLWSSVPSDVTRLGDRRATVGTRFTVTAAGTVTAVRVWRPRKPAARQTVGVWSVRGRLLASAKGRSGASSGGWRTVRLDEPLALRPGRTYVASHYARRGGPTATTRRALPDISATHLRFASRPGVRARGGRPQFPAGASDRVFLVSPVFRATPVTTVQPGSELRGWQVSPSSVGLAPLGLDCESLPVYTGSDHPPAGTTISRRRITSPIVLSGGSVIEESCMQPTSSWLGLPLISTAAGTISSPVTVRDSEVDGSLLDAQHSAFTGGFTGIADLQRNYMHHVGSGISFVDTGSVHSALVENNYVDNLTAYGDPSGDGNHSDAFTVRDFETAADPTRTLTVRNNRFDCDSGHDTGAIFIQTYNGDIGNVTFSGNLLEGEGYQLGLESGFGHGYSGMVAVDNRFSGTGWGPAYVGGDGPGWSRWSDNFIANPGAAGFRGRAVGRP